MKLPKELTTVTPLSKLLAMILFVSLPVAGFLVGMKHQQIISRSTTISYPTPTPLSSETSVKEDDETANWKTYKNTELGFEFKYPEVYKNANKGQNARSETLVFHVHNNEAVSIKGFLGTSTFDLENIRKAYAPTGNESLPESVAIGQYKFYRYGPGGGGVFYPDRYFFDLNGKLLIFEFFENRQTDKTPSKETKQLEADVLSTFKFTDNTAEKCATYTLNDQKTYACASCGNGVCEKYETCTATNFKDGVPPLPECGPLYCGKDCQ